MNPESPESYDLLVVGGGPGGAMCALTAAREGLKTLLIEKWPEGSTNHSHVVEMEKRVFDQCGISSPPEDEIAFTHTAIHVMSPSGKKVFSFDGDLTEGVHLDRLVNRLMGYARDHGSEIRYGWEALSPVVTGSAVRGATVRSPQDQILSIEAKLVVDASGFAAALVRKIPPVCGIDFTDHPSDHVVAENRIYEVRRTATGNSTYREHILPEQSYHQIGIQGSYSTLSYHVSWTRGTAFLLAGIKESQTPPTPSSVLDQLADRLGFLGPEIKRGGGHIRIRRAGFKLVCDGFATIGEAAGMVIPMYGSGVVSAMLAGHSIAQHAARLIRRNRPMTTENLWPWCSDYQRNRGAVLASYDANRRIAEHVKSPVETEVLMQSGLVQAEDMMPAISCEPLRVPRHTLPTRMAALARHPLALSPLVIRMPLVFLVEGLWNLYPRQWQRSRFAVWKRAARLMLP